MIDHNSRHLLMKVFVLLLMSLGTDIKAQIVTGARNLGLGNATVALPGIHSIRNNAAGIAWLERPSISAGYAEHFFNSQTRSLAGKAALPTGFASFGVHFQHYTFDNNYSETTTGLTLAKTFSSRLSLGLAANYHLENFAELVELSRFSVDIGAQYIAGELIALGLSIKNIQQLFQYGESEANNPSVISLGGVYSFSPQALLTTELSFLLQNRTDFAVGLEYLPLPWFFLRGGVSVNPFIQFVGAGLQFSDIVVDLATSFHPKLGYSPQVSVDYTF